MLGCGCPLSAALLSMDWLLHWTEVADSKFIQSSLWNSWTEFTCLQRKELIQEYTVNVRNN